MDISVASQHMPRRGMVLTRKQVTGAIQTFGSNFTFHETMTAEAAFSMVRVVFANSGASSYSVEKCKVAPSAKLNGVNPVTASDAAVSWSSVTFGGSESGTVPAGTGSGATAVPGLLASDWMPITSLDRADGGSYPIIMTRAYCSNTMSGDQTSLYNFAAVDAGREVEGYYQFGDHVTTPTTMTSPTGPAGGTGLSYSILHAVQFLSQKRGLTVAAYGDSIFQGYGSSDPYGFNGWVIRACAALSTPDFPVSPINGGYAGRTTANTYLNAVRGLELFKPDVQFIQVFSPNDSFSAAAADLSYGRAMMLADLAQRAGAVPILCTPTPWSYTGSTETARQGLVSRVRSSGLLYADFEAAISDGANPARVAVAFADNDGLHPNTTAGQDALGVAATVPLGVVVRSMKSSGMPL